LLELPGRADAARGIDDHCYKGRQGLQSATMGACVCYKGAVNVLLHVAPAFATIGGGC
jgi:hypothetical protein